MKIVIVGGGIGGLTAAALLHRRGHDVLILEKAGEFGEVGAGLQISPNGSRVLAELGLAGALRDIGTTATRIAIRRWQDDAVLLNRPLGDAPAARFGHAYYNAYRPDLIEILTRAAAEVPVRFRTTVTAVGSTPDGSQATVELADGTALNADVVIGADGIRSLVRESLFGHQPTRFSGWLAYRALVPRSAVPDEPIEITNRLGPRAHVVSYFVGREQRHFNLVCVVPEAEWDVESWLEPGDLGELRRHFAGWSPRLNAILDHVEEPIFRWALHDREPLAQWSVGRISLLGDACHPMVPFMAQGACQAIEDAAVLARCLDDADPSDTEQVVRALSTYELTRLPRSSDIQRRSFANATTYHYPDGPAQQKRDDQFRAISSTGGDGLDTMAWLYGYDALNADLAVPKPG